MTVNITELEYDQDEKESRPDFLKYNSHAEEILSSLQPAEGQTRLQAMQLAYAEYIQREPNQSLREQAEIIILAVGACQWTRQKAKAQDPEKANELKGRLINYNHGLSAFIYHNPDGVYKDDLVRWLASASGDKEWAQSIVSGAGGEVALRRKLDEHPRVNVYPGTIEEDRQGIDLVAVVDNPKVGTIHYGIDVKVRRATYRHYNHLEPVETKVIDGNRLRTVEWSLREDDIAENFTVSDEAIKTQLYELINTTKMPIAM